MGSRGYTAQDYADRIVSYLHKHPGVRTRDIIDEVRGTNYRLMEGLLWAVDEGEITYVLKKHVAWWYVKE